MGQKNGQKIKKTLLQPLKKIGLITKRETCEVLNTCMQTEGECGIRTMEYMMQFKDWATKDNEAREIIECMKKFVLCETKDRSRLARRYRHKIHRTLQEEKRLISE